MLIEILRADLADLCKQLQYAPRVPRITRTTEDGEALPPVLKPEKHGEFKVREMRKHFARGAGSHCQLVVPLTDMKRGPTNAAWANYFVLCPY